MIGGGTSYHVYFRKSDKPSHPISNGTYSTTILLDRGEYFEVATSIKPRSIWGMECGWDKYHAYQRVEKVADRLAVRIAKRAFPELRGLRKLPTLWAGWNQPTAKKWVKVNLTLPE